MKKVAIENVMNATTVCFPMEDKEAKMFVGMLFDKHFERSYTVENCGIVNVFTRKDMVVRIGEEHKGLTAKQASKLLGPDSKW